MNKSLTIVLPVYNAETRLENNVAELLELASELTSRFGVLIIDDGSTDATFEVASELAAHYPQVSLQRHRHRRGLGAAFAYVQRHVRSDAILIHDGVTPIDARQMRRTWQGWVARSWARENRSADMEREGQACDFGELPAIHAGLEQAHRRVLGFHVLSRGAPDDERWLNTASSGAPNPRTDSAHPRRPSGVGQVPPLPRPNFLTAVAEFALGE